MVENKYNVVQWRISKVDKRYYNNNRVGRCTTVPAARNRRDDTGTRNPRTIDSYFSPFYRTSPQRSTHYSLLLGTPRAVVHELSTWVTRRRLLPNSNTHTLDRETLSDFIRRRTVRKTVHHSARSKFPCRRQRHRRSVCGGTRGAGVFATVVLCYCRQHRKNAECPVIQHECNNKIKRITKYHRKKTALAAGVTSGGR